MGSPGPVTDTAMFGPGMVLFLRAGKGVQSFPVSVPSHHLEPAIRLGQ
jgi:hypothetical protein